MGKEQAAHDKCSRNWRHKSTPFFWRRFIVPCAVERDGQTDGRTDDIMMPFVAPLWVQCLFNNAKSITHVSP